LIDVQILQKTQKNFL